MAEVARYLCDETSGTTVHDSIGTLHGTMKDGDGSPAGIVGGLSYLDVDWLLLAVDNGGTNAFISFPSHPLAGATAWTMSCWTRLFKTPDGSAANILSHDGSHDQAVVYFSSSEDQERQLILNDPNFDSTQSEKFDGAIHFITVTYNGSIYNLYLDGIGGNNIDAVGATVVAPLQIGAQGGTAFANILVRDVRFFNTALNDAAVLAMYDAGIAEMTQVEPHYQTFTSSGDAPNETNHPNLIPGSETFILQPAGGDNAGGGGACGVYFRRPGGEKIVTVHINNSSDSENYLIQEDTGVSDAVYSGQDGPEGNGGTVSSQDFSVDIAFDGGNGNLTNGGGGAGTGSPGQDGTAGDPGDANSMIDAVLADAGFVGSTAGGIGGVPDPDGRLAGVPGGGGGDGGAGGAGRVIALWLAPLNHAPTAVALSRNVVDNGRNTTSGYTVGTLSTTDPDEGDTFTYTIVGGADQAKFSISTASLVLTDGVLNYNTKSSYAVTIRSTDSGSLTKDQAFTIYVLEAINQPIALSISLSI